MTALAAALLRLTTGVETSVLQRRDDLKMKRVEAVPPPAGVMKLVVVRNYLVAKRAEGEAMDTDRVVPEAKIARERQADVPIAVAIARAVPEQTAATTVVPRPIQQEVEQVLLSDLATAAHDATAVSAVIITMVLRLRPSLWSLWRI
jgi:hypothetical protein